MLAGGYTEHERLLRANIYEAQRRDRGFNCRESIRCTCPSDKSAVTGRCVKDALVPMARKKERDSGTLFDVFETANGRKDQSSRIDDTLFPGGADVEHTVGGNGLVQADVAETQDDRVPPGSDLTVTTLPAKKALDPHAARQRSLFESTTTSVRRAAPVDDEPVSHEPLRSLDLTQQGMFAETEVQRVETFEGCKVDKPPVVSGSGNKKEWVCTFRTPPDLWHQERNDLVHARTGTKELISMANKARLQPGDLATVVGIVTLEQELMIEGKFTHLTFINITDIRPGLRASNSKINGRSPSRRQ